MKFVAGPPAQISAILSSVAIEPMQGGRRPPSPVRHRGIADRRQPREADHHEPAWDGANMSSVCDKPCSGTPARRRSPVSLKGIAPLLIAAVMLAACSGSGATQAPASGQASGGGQIIVGLIT